LIEVVIIYTAPSAPVSRAQLTGGPSLPESATAHARPTYLSRWSEFTGVVYYYLGPTIILVPATTVPLV